MRGRGKLGEEEGQRITTRKVGKEGKGEGKEEGREIERGRRNVVKAML